MRRRPSIDRIQLGDREGSVIDDLAMLRREACRAMDDRVTMARRDTPGLCDRRADPAHASARHDQV
jgi:hypothetical protein